MWSVLTDPDVGGFVKAVLVTGVSGEKVDKSEVREVRFDWLLSGN
jgi:hypothetical protein